VFDTQAALCAVLVAVTTPLLFRMPTTYYPEVMEIAFAGGATALTLLGLRQQSAGSPMRHCCWRPAW
jgi:4-amino-4-deoxy-L-arabinose transferase-like glycosyltransferase